MGEGRFDYSTPPEERPYPCNTYGEDHICDRCTQARRGYHRPFMPYFDKTLGCEITGPGQKARVLKEKGLIEVGGEFDRHIAGKRMEPVGQSLATEREVAEKLSEIQERFKHDRQYRQRYGAPEPQETD